MSELDVVTETQGGTRPKFASHSRGELDERSRRHLSHGSCLRLLSRGSRRGGACPTAEATLFGNLDRAPRQTRTGRILVGPSVSVSNEQEKPGTVMDQIAFLTAKSSESWEQDDVHFRLSGADLGNPDLRLLPFVGWRMKGLEAHSTKHDTAGAALSSAAKASWVA